MSMTVEQALKRIDEKFTSGNSVPVERAFITREEWEAVRSHIEREVVVTDEMVRVALVRYQGIETPFTRNVAMKAALIAALEGK